MTTVNDAFWERVEHLRSSANMTQERLSKKLGLSHRAIGSWKQRQHIPPGDVCVSLAQIFGTTVEYLITGEELSLPDDDFIEPKPSEYRNEKGIISADPDEPLVKIPIAPQKLSAGVGQEFLSPSAFIGHVSILKRMVRGLDPSSLVAAEVRGDSMIGINLSDGDIVVFTRGIVSGEGLYVISLFGEVKVKRLEFRRSENIIVVSSENSQYSPETVPLDSPDLVVLGKVVGWVHCHPY